MTSIPKIKKVIVRKNLENLTLTLIVCTEGLVWVGIIYKNREMQMVVDHRADKMIRESRFDSLGQYVLANGQDVTGIRYPHFHTKEEIASFMDHK